MNPYGVLPTAVVILQQAVQIPLGPSTYPEKLGILSRSEIKQDLRISRPHSTELYEEGKVQGREKICPFSWNSLINIIINLLTLFCSNVVPDRTEMWPLERFYTELLF